MYKFLFSSGIALFLVGCASPKYNYQAIPKQISKPPLNTINTAFVGDQLLEQGKVTEREVLYLSKTTKKSGYTFLEGYYLKTGDDKKGQYFQALNNIPNGGNVQKNVIVDPFRAVMLDSEKRLCIITIMNVKACTDEHNATLTTVGVPSDNSFQQTLIYSGKVGSKINVGYREFSSNVARPAFNNDVEYDLSQSTQIGYKGALLEVIEATNQNITYKVLKNFNKVD